MNYKLLNVLMLLLIVLIIYVTRDLWLGIYGVVINIIKPIVVSSMISYAFNVYLKKLNMIFNTVLSVCIFILSIVFFAFLIFRLFFCVAGQLTDCVNKIYVFLRDFFVSYNIDFIDLYRIFDKYTNFNLIGIVFKYITFIIIVVVLSIYIFLYWNKIKDGISGRVSSGVVLFLSNINVEMEKYTISFFKLVIINMIEYSVVFLIVGHPNYLVLGFIAGVFSVLPVIGGFITNIFGLITAVSISYKLFIRSLIGILVLSILDGYIVSPFVYSKSNRIHPVLIIISVFVFDKLFGLIGIVMAVPFLIVIMNGYEYIKK